MTFINKKRAPRVLDTAAGCVPAYGVGIGHAPDGRWLWARRLDSDRVEWVTTPDPPTDAGMTEEGRGMTAGFLLHAVRKIVAARAAR